MAFKIYTKAGDNGSTGLYGGERVPKDHVRIDAYGTVDELNSHIGLLRGLLQRDLLSQDEQSRERTLTDDSRSLLRPELLAQIQSSLFTLGSQLATPSGKTTPVKPVGVTEIAALEAAIDAMDEQLPQLTTFILPGGGISASQSHVCRTVTRRAERCVVALDHLEPVDPIIIMYLNRLSDYFFTLSRAITLAGGESDTAWKPEA